MKRRLLFNTLYLLPMLMMALLFAACSDDDDNFGGENSANSHIGQWFLDQSSPGKILWSEMSLDAMGNYSSNLIISSRKEALNHRVKSKTTYYREGNTLVCQEDYPSTGGGISTERYDIIYVDKYTFTWSYAIDGSTETYNRIVDEYYINVGDSIPFGFNDSEFTNANYKSTDERIAQVDDYGNITAIKHGTTYITARANVGAITIKVHVIDFEQPYTEYGADLTLTKKQIINKYGKDYDELQDHSLVYYLGDMDTKAVHFRFTNHDKVKAILVDIWDHSYITEMAGFFASKYKRKGQEDNGFNLFVTADDKCSYYIYTDLKTYTNGYERILSDFEKYDDLIVNSTADELAAAFKCTIGEEYEDRFQVMVEEGNMYDYMTIMYNNQTRRTSIIMCTLKEEFSLEKATEIVKELYPYYLDGMGYHDGTRIPYTYIRIEKNKRTGRVIIKYYKLK